MITYSQMGYKRSRVQRVKKVKIPVLRKCPHKKAHIERLLTKAPKKPHSARRRVAFVKIISTKRTTHVYIPGIGHSLYKFAKVLIRGGRRREIPNMKCQLLRGKMDAGIVEGRRKGRSKYGMRLLGSKRTIG
jgi:small subunit ribosomal protein S12